MTEKEALAIYQAGPEVVVKSRGRKVFIFLEMKKETKAGYLFI
jgi:hypothetical protein